MVQQEKRRVVVSELLEGRYQQDDGSFGERPLSWDERVSGRDRIRTEDGEEIALFSDGQQSPPQPGWVLLLLEPVSQEEFPSKEPHLTWTLYGMRRTPAAA
ncbi:hypothetical protein MRY87_09175 [bacterium]|nr:hypothetical protein [bacterium]